MDNGKADKARQAALDTVDDAEKHFRRVVCLAALVEAVLLGTYLAVMNFGDRLHWLILIAAILVYSTIGVGIVALATHSHKNTLRILKALELDRSES